MATKYYFFHRNASNEIPTGTTVSKKPKLPDGDFLITEYEWHDLGQFCVLWFVDKDHFTVDERESAKNDWLNF